MTISKRKNPLIGIAIALLALATFYPSLFTLLTSLKTNFQFNKNYWGLSLPLHFENYLFVIKNIYPHILNSIRYSFLNLIVVIVVSMLGGYAFARYQFKGKSFLFITVLGLLMIPGLMTLLPIFILVRDIGWLNTTAGLVTAWASLEVVVATLLMRIYFEKIPPSLFEAASLDGASDTFSLFKIAVPLSLPAVGSVAIVDLLFSWNDLFWPLIALTGEKQAIAPTILKVSGDQIAHPFASYVLATLPIGIIFIFTVKYFIYGTDVSVAK